MKRAGNESRHRRALHGFTIVELLIVIVIIAIIATIIVVTYRGISQRAIEASMQADLDSARSAIAVLKAGHKNYPTDASAANNGAGLKASGGNQISYGASSTGYSVAITNPGTTKKFCLINGIIGECVGGLVTTLAGTKDNYTAADGTGSAAGFGWAESIVMGIDGNLYVGDCGGAIRKVTPAGVVTTFAGQNQTYGYVDGPVATARFNCPAGLATDSSGAIYTTEWNGALYGVRKISGGVVSTIAGSGTTGYLDGTGTAAQFGAIYGIVADSSGNLYVADYVTQWNGSATVHLFSGVRKITPSGVVTTLAGSSVRGSADGTGTAAQFDRPTGLAIDKSNNIYVADSNNNRIRKITPAGVVTTFAGGVSGFLDGTGTAAQFNYPTGMTIDKNSNLYVTDGDNYAIRKITPAGVVTTVAGSGSAGYVNAVGKVAQFDWMEDGIAVDANGALYVPDSGNYVLRKIVP